MKNPGHASAANLMPIGKTDLTDRSTSNISKWIDVHKRLFFYMKDLIKD